MKKIFTLFAVSLMAVGVSAQTWNFSEWEEQTFTETTVVDGLTVCATADKSVVIDANNKTFNDVQYTKRLKFGGTGAGPESETPSRYLSFELPAGASVSIICTSASSGEDRTLNFATGSFDNIVATGSAPGGSLSEFAYTNDGGATTAYVYSAKSGINLYAIYVTGGGGQTTELVETATLWEGSVLVNGWANQPQLLSDGGAELSAAGAQAGDVVRFYMNAPDQNWQCELFEGHWNGMYVRWSEQDLGYEADGSKRESVIVDLTNKGYADFELTDEVLQKAYTPGGWGGVFLLNGDGNLTCTKLVLCKKGGSVDPQPQVGDWMELVHNGDVEGADGVSLLTKNGDGDGGFIFNPQAGVGIDGSRAAVVHAIGNAVNEWDSQFFIYAPGYVFQGGEEYKVSFWVRADNPTSVTVQAHRAPGDYLHWWVITDGSQVNISTEWTEVTFQGTAAAEHQGMQTIAFNLNQDKTLENNYYFDNISWQVLVTEGIEEMANTKPVMSNQRFNLAGQRVDDSYKGVVIMNGRKYIQK